MPDEYLLLQALLELCSFFESDPETQNKILYELIQIWKSAQDKCITRFMQIILSDIERCKNATPFIINRVIRKIIRTKIGRTLTNISSAENGQIDKVYEVLKICFENSL